jgi:hypothetical protein
MRIPHDGPRLGSAPLRAAQHPGHEIWNHHRTLWLGTMKAELLGISGL